MVRLGVGGGGEGFGQRAATAGHRRRLPGRVRRAAQRPMRDTTAAAATTASVTTATTVAFPAVAPSAALRCGEGEVVLGPLVAAAQLVGQERRLYAKVPASSGDTGLRRIRVRGGTHMHEREWGELG